jgi:prepilin-type N-terminal cleavage/methylation domain-containing protein
MQHDYHSTVNASGVPDRCSCTLFPAISIFRYQAGFTLMELMIAIAIICIMAATAIPNGIAWHFNAQFNGSTREIKSIIEDTRMSAIKANLPATITFNGTGTFTTQTQDIVAWVTTPGPIVNHQTATGVTVSANNGGVLTFNNRGMPQNGLGSTVTLQYNGLSRQIIVSSVGSSRIQ